MIIGFCFTEIQLEKKRLLRLIVFWNRVTETNGILRLNTEY